ncbi:MAG TPA: urate hydroxylase PuuD [Bacteroidia bacterium]
MKYKIISLVLFLFVSSNVFAAQKFSTNFNSYHLLFILLFVGIIWLTIYALQSAIDKLNKIISKEESPASEKLKDKVEEMLQAKTVLFYCSLLFIFLFTCYAFVKGTNMESHIIEWMNLVIRWMHVLFGIAWIGASFYFVFLENALNRTTNLKEGIAGNLWAIHGGGIYFLEKYKVVPAEIPKDLHWFKYESYFTWLSGFTLLVIVYYLDANVYLIDPNVMVLTPVQAIAIGLGTLLLGWIVYDALCKSFLANHQALLSVIILLFTALVAWFLSHIFSSRAAYIHVGAMLGTIMTGNVFRVIIPGQKRMVSLAKEGKEVDPTIGQKALLRSRHNNYFTLPVIFIMISNHFPSTYGSAFNWIILIGLTIASVLIKHYLNLHEKGEKSVWILPVGIALILSLAFITRPITKSVCKEDALATFTEVNAIIQERCVSCHSANPTDEVIKVAPNNIMFDKPEDILKFSERINQRVVITQTMPQANKTGITQAERDIIACWIENGAQK